MASIRYVIVTFGKAGANTWTTETRSVVDWRLLLDAPFTPEGDVGGRGDGSLGRVRCTQGLGCPSWFTRRSSTIPAECHRKIDCLLSLALA
jgi:hypothetical protein